MKPKLVNFSHCHQHLPQPEKRSVNFPIRVHSIRGWHRVERADVSASSAQHDDTNFLLRFSEVERLIYRRFNLRYPDKRIARREAPPLIFNLHLLCSKTSLLQRLWYGSALLFQQLERFGRARSPYCTFCNAVDNGTHLL